MKKEKIVSKVSELLGENLNVVAEAIIGGIKKVTTLEDLSSIEKELRGVHGEDHIDARIFRSLAEQRELLSLEEVKAAITEDQIVRAFSRISLRHTEASELAICKLATLLENKEKEKEDKHKKPVFSGLF